MRETLIDRIYEAAGTPEFWPDVLQCFGETAHSDGGVLMVLPPTGTPRWIASPSLERRLRHHTDAASWRDSGRTAQWRALAQGSFVRDVDLPADLDLALWATFPFEDPKDSMASYWYS